LSRIMAHVKTMRRPVAAKAMAAMSMVVPYTTRWSGASVPKANFTRSARRREARSPVSE
jgi:hypothetical protein